jgi:hypothetical protein
MRSFLAGFVFASILFTADVAVAEKRVFIIDANASGYGVDRCLSSGASCGSAVANSYCRSREFNHALSFRKIDREEITGAVPTSANACHGAGCTSEFIAIECMR